MGSNPDGDRTETDVFQARLHQSPHGSRRPDRRPPGTAACTRFYHLGQNEIAGLDTVFLISSITMQSSQRWYTRNIYYIFLMTVF